MDEAGEIVPSEPPVAPTSAHRTSIADNADITGGARTWIAISH
jgi:hypothetical protein